MRFAIFFGLVFLSSAINPTIIEGLIGSLSIISGILFIMDIVEFVTRVKF